MVSLRTNRARVGAWLGGARGFRRTAYNQTSANLSIVTLERYGQKYRAAYSLYVSQLPGLGVATSHSLQACLPLINDPADVTIVRACLSHPQWLVRVEAVAALGRVGTADDEAGLAALLSDPHWWVRYRAAHSLATLPASNVPQLQRLAAAQTNPFAHDILTEVIAERELAEGLPV